MGKQRKPGQQKTGFKNRQNKCAVVFDEKERQEFLTGFHKRKVERRKAAVEEIKNKLKEEQKRLREERHKEYLKMLKERKEALEDADELDDVVTSTTESLQYDHPNHTVTVTTISDLDLSGARLLESLTSQAAGVSDGDKGEGDEEEKIEALPRKAGNPLLSKRSSLCQHRSTPSPNRRRKKVKRTLGGEISRATGSHRLPWATSIASARQQRSSDGRERVGKGGVRTEELLRIFITNQITTRSCEETKSNRLQNLQRCSSVPLLYRSELLQRSWNLVLTCCSTTPQSNTGQGCGLLSCVYTWCIFECVCVCVCVCVCCPLPIMPSTGDERVCAKFQPNIFNPSRCHECLRLKHLHTHTPTHTPEQVNLVTESSSSSREEKEQSTKEDSDDVSVVSGGSLCILSPECDLYVCDGDESQDEDEHTCNSQCEGDSSSTGSFTPEEEDGFFSLALSRMTRLDPSSHRNNPRMWMEEARNRESFFRRSSVPHVSSKVEQDRESGYFSLGRVTGARTLSDKSPSPHRHAERGHPLPSNRTHEPKAAIPFRNPDLGVPSQRRTTEIQNPDLTLLPLNPSPEPVDLSIEVEAQTGPRSLSPTPFKQAEALGASQKKGFRSPSSPSSKNLFSSKQDSGFSRSLSPSRSATPFKRAESVSSLSSRGYGMDGVSERRDQPCKSPNRNSFGRPSESEAIRKTFRGFASTVGAVSNLNKSQTSPYADLRAGLRKTEPPSGQGAKTRSPSPARRSQDAAGRTFLRKTEPPSGQGSKTRSPSPARRSQDAAGRTFLRKTEPPSGQGSKTRSPSPARRTQDAAGRTFLRKTEPPSGQGSKTRSPSPARRSQDAAGRTFLRKTEPPSGQGSKTRSPSPARRSQDAAGQSFLRKTESKTVSNNQKKFESRTSSPSRSSSRSILRKVVEGWRSASPVRKGYGTASQMEKSLVSNGRSHNGSNSSSSRRSFETSSLSLHKSETKRLSPILRRSYDAPTKQSSLHKSGSDRSSYNRSPSPSKQDYGSPGQSDFRSDQSNYSRPVPVSLSRSPSPSKRDYDPTGQSHFRSDHSNYSRPVPASLSRCPSPSKHGCDPPGQSHFRSDYNNYSGSIRSSNSQSFSPSKWDHDPSGQSRFQKSESSKRTEASRSSCNQSLSSSKRSYDPSDQSSFRSEHSNYSKSKRGQTILNKTVSESRSVSASYMEKSADSSTAGSWRGSTHSLLSPPMSRNSSPSRKCNDSEQLGDRKSSHVSWSTNERKQSQDNHSPASWNRSPSPLSRSHTSSQSSIDSVMSSGSSGMNREEYAIMADLPKVKKVLQRARPNQMEGMERGTREETSLYKPASHSHTKPAHITWDDMMDQRGNPSSTHTPSHTEGNKMEQEKSEKVHQSDIERRLLVMNKLRPVAECQCCEVECEVKRCLDMHFKFHQFREKNTVRLNQSLHGRVGVRTNEHQV